MKYKAVIIDDNEFIIESIAKAIPWDKMDCEVVAVAKNGIDGEKLIKDVNPHIIITDIKMPGIDGLQMIRRIKAQHPQSVIIIITGYSDFEYAQQAVKLGVFDFITKPIQYDKLATIIAKGCTRLKKYEEEKRINEKLIQKSNKLSANFKEQVGYVRKSFLFDIVNGNGLDIIILENLLKETNLYRKSYQFIYLYSLNESSISKDSIQICLQGHKEKYPVIFDCIDFKMDNDYFVVFFYKTSTSNEALAKMQQIIPRNMTEFVNHGSENYFVLSDTIKTDTASMRKSYEGIRKIKESRLIDDIGQKYNFIFDILLEKKSNHIDLEVVEKLKNKLKACTLDESEAVLNEFINDLVNNYSELYNIKSVIYELCIAMLDKMKRMNQGETLNRINKKIWIEIDGIKSRSQLQQYITNYINELKQDSNLSSEYTPFIQQVLIYIKENCYANISLLQVAAKFGVSASYMGHIIKKEIGKNYTVILTEYKVEAAKSLLLNLAVKVNEVGNMVGFGEYVYFYQVFKKYTGMSPKEYRVNAIQQKGLDSASRL